MKDEERFALLRRFFGRTSAPRRSLRFRVEQDIVGFEYVERGGTSVARFSIDGYAAVALVSNAANVSVLTAADGTPLHMRPDLIAEYVTTMFLLSNRFLDLTPVECDLDIDHIAGMKAIRVDVPAGGPLYLWTTEVGGLVTSSMRLGDRVVTLAPLAYDVLSDGSRFVTLWRRDKETPMRIVSVVLNGDIADAELAVPALG